MTLSIDTTLLTNITGWIGKAHNAYIDVVGNETDPNSPGYWLETVKSYARGGNDLTTGITAGSAVAVAQVGPGVTVNVTGGAVTINGAAVTAATNATFGSSTIFTQTCTDGTALLTGQFYDAALCCDHLGALVVFRGPREDRADTETRPAIPQGHCLLATLRVRYSAGTSSIATADITLGPTLTAYAAPTNDPAARIFSDFDAGQTRLIARSAVKTELGFALTSLDTYVTTITRALALGTNGAGYSFLAWARYTHSTATPWDFPSGFVEFIRVMRTNNEPAQRMATVSFTGSGTATISNKNVTLGKADSLELIVTNAAGTGAAASTITVTVQTFGSATSTVYSAVMPANSPQGTIVALASSGTAALQSPLAGSAARARISASNVLAAQPTGTVTLRGYTALVPSSPIAVSGGTNADVICVRNVGVI